MSQPVERLTPAHRDEAVVVLSEAFYDYPVMRFVLADAGRSYDQHLSALVSYFCSRRLVHDGWVLGVRVDGDLAGISVFDQAGAAADAADDVDREWLRMLERDIGARAVARLAAYDEVAEALMPDGDYHYLGMLGVRSEVQGMGLGRRLVDATQAHANESQLSTGVCLHTENPKNVSLYGRMGFETVGEADVGTLRTWCMFSPASKAT